MGTTGITITGTIANNNEESTQYFISVFFDTIFTGKLSRKLQVT